MNASALLHREERQTMTTAIELRTPEDSVSTDADCSGVDMCLSCLQPTHGRGVILGCLCGPCGLHFVRTGRLPDKPKEVEPCTAGN